jgi:DnaJ-class molecular chaperone
MAEKKKKLVTCDECGGTGMLEDDECTFCLGEGKIEVNEEETWDPQESGDYDENPEQEDLDEILDDIDEEDNL